MEPGDVLFLNKLTMHASLPNLSEDVRWSVDVRYQPTGEPTGRPLVPGLCRSKPVRAGERAGQRRGLDGALAAGSRAPGGRGPCVVSALAGGRLDSALNLHPHFHVLMLDGVYACSEALYISLYTDLRPPSADVVSSHYRATCAKARAMRHTPRALGVVPSQAS